MIPLLRPRSIQNALKASSKDIVEAFLRIEEDAAEVDTVVVGRKAVNVYTALYLYVRNHPELGVKVKSNTTVERTTLTVYTRKHLINSNSLE